jgi:hypothetical protein
MLYETEKMSPWVRHEKLRRHDSRLDEGSLRCQTCRDRADREGDVHGLRIADFEELEILRLDLDPLALWQLGSRHP